MPSSLCQVATVSGSKNILPLIGSPELLNSPGKKYLVKEVPRPNFLSFQVVSQLASSHVALGLIAALGFEFLDSFCAIDLKRSQC